MKSLLKGGLYREVISVTRYFSDLYQRMVQTIKKCLHFNIKLLDLAVCLWK